jgi:hypothetical protein
MYGLAFVFLSPDSGPLQDELNRTLAPFKRGGDDDFPRRLLTFDSSTPALTELHQGQVEWSRNGNGTRWLGPGHQGIYMLDSSKLREHLTACNLDKFTGTLAELEPDFDTFVKRFTREDPRDPATNDYGRWLNPLGMWDWWELGGRFNGVITGDPRQSASDQIVSSGPSTGRAILGNMARAFGAEPSVAEAEIEANVELIETLLAELLADDTQLLPSAILLPAGDYPDSARWLDDLEWHAIRPETRMLLGAGPDDDYRTLIGLAYSKYRTHAAAGIAYHF